MSFVKTQAELDRYYGLGVRRFTGAQMMGVMFQTRPEIVVGLLPPPLAPTDSPDGLIFIAQYPETNLGPGYREAALYLKCQYRGEAGTYCLSMPITAEARMHNGRDIFGLPKKLADIHFAREGDQVHGYVERAGVRFVEISLKLLGNLPNAPETGPTFLFKAMPRIDLQPGFDGPVFLAKQRTLVAARQFEIGVPEIVLRPSPTDPWAEVEIVTIMAGFCMVADNTMLPGEILGEVDAAAFLPHYFKMTDFATGD
ncbi:MAG: acetoacetate decarboxylase family protein [Myxococcales bacterium]|nr:acetoacetate decarboxylase family protein [Myxococcales bacterium]